MKENNESSEAGIKLCRGVLVEGCSIVVKSMIEQSFLYVKCLIFLVKYLKINY